MADSDIIKQQAREWVDRLNSGAGLEGAWRLQRIEKRSRVAVEGEEAKELPVRIRRFAKGIPVNFVDEAIRYLISTAPYEDIVYNGTRMEGKYSPTRTWWERDDQAVVNRGQMRENTYTIYQDLIDRDHADLEEFDAGGNCSEEVSMRYEYDTFTIEDVPPGGQGVTRSVQAISRNEDGTFNYAVVTRTAKTAVGDEQTVKCDEFQTVTQQTYQNLYGTEGHYTDESGAYISLPKPCDDRSTGVLIEVQVRKNDDCTYDATVTRTSSKSVAPSEHSKQKTLRGVTETTVSRNVTNDSVVVSKIGDRVQVERNADGTVNRSVTTASNESVGDIGSDCQKTVFEHEHSEVRNEASRPSEEAGSASGGVIHQVTSRATEEGTWDVTRKTTTEIENLDARHSKRKSLRGVTETVVKRNTGDSSVVVKNIGDEVTVEKTPGGKWNRTETTAAKEDVGDTGASCQKTIFEHEHTDFTNVATRPGKEVAEAGGGVVHERTARATEEGTWDVIEKTTTEKNVPSAVVVKRKTLRGVTESVTHRNVDDGEASVTNVGDEVRVEKTPGGLYNRTQTSITPEPVGEIARGCSKTAAEHTDTVTVNQPDPELGHASYGTNFSESIESRETEEGTYDVTTRTTTFSPLDTGSRSVGHSAPHPVDSVVEWSGVNQTHVPSVTGGANKDVRLSVSANDHGSMTVSTTTTQYRAVTTYGASAMAKANRGEDTVECFGVTNVTSPVVDISASDGELIAGLSADMNGHGSLDVRWQKIKAEPYDTWDVESDGDFEYKKITWFKHASQAQYKALVKQETAAFDAKVSGWSTGGHPPTSFSTSPSVQPEEYKNRFSGSISVTATWSAMTGGKNGQSRIFADGYTYSSRNSNYHRDYHAVGFGKDQLERLLNASHGDGTHVFKNSFSINPDFTWTFTESEDNW